MKIRRATIADVYEMSDRALEFYRKAAMGEVLVMVDSMLDRAREW